MADTYLNYKPVDLRVIHDRVSLWEAKTDAKAPLSSEQKNLVHDLGCTSAQRPLPKNLPEDDTQSLTPARLPSQDKDKVDDTSGLSSFMKDLKLPYTNKIENAQQFFSWFSELEEALERDDGGLYRQYTDELTQYKDQCSNILTEVNKALDYLQQLSGQYVHVATKTNALHEECEHLLAEQTHLMDLAESISNKLSYFNELDSISAKLSRPNLNVTGETFIPLLSRMDECILYLKSNPRYKECDVYLARFRQCLNKALSLIKNHVNNVLLTATQQVQPKKDSPNITDNAFTLFYGKFRANAPRVKALTEQLELRTEKDNEYANALADCQAFYFSQRETLLGPSIATTISDLASKHIRDHCALMRSGCAFMVHVCEDEYQLYFNFFSKATPLLDAMLERICNNLYDVFRPLIIHINHLETLSELCSILKVEMMEEHVKQNPQELAAFESICQQMLMDIQERLVYRTYIYIKSDILQYNAAPGDLAYPEKLEMMESIAESIKSGKSHQKKSTHVRHQMPLSTSQEVAMLTGAADSSNDSSFVSNGSVRNGEGNEEDELQEISLERSLDDTGSNMPMSPADLHGMWYPTVRRALETLSKLYRCIDIQTGFKDGALAYILLELNICYDGPWTSLLICIPSRDVLTLDDITSIHNGPSGLQNKTTYMVITAINRAQFINDAWNLVNAYNNGLLKSTEEDLKILTGTEQSREMTNTNEGAKLAANTVTGEIKTTTENCSRIFTSHLTQLGGIIFLKKHLTRRPETSDEQTRTRGDHISSLWRRRSSLGCEGKRGATRCGSIHHLV
ncbi:Golgi transport complex subunit 3 [Bulinus truncatus]|nr:Golgi transport complex subunit 3 [Bulinus truncatus]